MFDVGTTVEQISLLGDYSVTISVVGGDTLYYDFDPVVNSGNNSGSLTSGQSQTFTHPVWVASASRSSLRLSFQAEAPSSGVSGVPIVNGALGTALGAAQNLVLVLGQETWLLGLLSANLTATVTTFPAGSKGKIIAQQDGTGSRTLTVTVTGGGSTVVPIPAQASGAPFEVLVESLDGTAANVVVTLLSNPDASTSQKGAAKLSVAPASPSNPIALAPNDPTVPHYAVLTADLAAIASQPTLQPISGLQVPIGASPTEIWLVEWWMMVTGANTTMDIKYGLTVPAGCTVRWGIQSGSTTVAGWNASPATVSPLALLNESGTAVLGSNTTAQMGSVINAIIFGGGTAGNVIPQYAQNTSDAGTLVMNKGSLVRYTNIHA